MFSEILFRFSLKIGDTNTVSHDFHRVSWGLESCRSRFAHHALRCFFVCLYTLLQHLYASWLFSFSREHTPQTLWALLPFLRGSVQPMA